MHPMHKVSVALVAAILAIAPVATFAAVTAPMVTGMKTDALPATSVVDMIGTWNDSYSNVFSKAKSIKVYDTKTLYTQADLQKISAAVTSKHDQLDKLRSALRGDANLKTWFDTNKVDISRVIAVADPNGNAEIFLN